MMRQSDLSMRHSSLSALTAVRMHARILLVILFAAAATRLFLVLNLPIQILGLRCA